MSGGSEEQVLELELIWHFPHDWDLGIFGGKPFS
jgi:hypothetical protein